MDYHIYHMFPNLLNLYGDQGNITTLKYFAKELGLNPIVHEIVDVEDIDWNNIDFMLIGGGSDREQLLVTQHLSKIKEPLKQAVEDGLPLLAVCGGYQFLGHYYQDSQGNKMEGLGILDMYTIGQTKKRMVANCIIKTDNYENLIGFVNHAGETFHDLDTLGEVIYGYGNNLEAKTEGVKYRNLIGTYLHGPLLPKNPNLTLSFLKKFADKKQLKLDFEGLDLSMEKQAREYMSEKISKENS